MWWFIRLIGNVLDDIKILGDFLLDIPLRCLSVVWALYWLVGIELRSFWVGVWSFRYYQCGVHAEYGPGTDES